MTKKIFQLNSTITNIEEKAEENGTAVLKIAGYASTSARDRAGDIILPDAWTRGGMDNYEKNPILLFNHNYSKPIGKVELVETDDRGLKVKGIISKSAGDVYGLIKEGILSTFSVGFLIKDADYDRGTDGLIVKDAELLEVSVVSVPCNQDATFSVAKSFDSTEDYQNFVEQFKPVDSEQGAGDAVSAPKEKKKMEEDDVNGLIQKAIADALIASEKAREEKAAKEAQEKASKEAEEKRVSETVSKVLKDHSEKLYEEMEKRFTDETTTLEEKLAGVRTELQEKTEELAAISKSKRNFADRSSDNTTSWKKEFAQEVDNSFLLARITGKGYETDYAKNVMEKVNAHSGIEVPSADFEQEVSTNIERDIQNELILKPLFREIQMNTASMLVPIMPDVGYAEITASSGTTTGVAPHGTLDSRGGSDRAGANMTEIDLRTSKMVAKTYLGNETEEDGIIPILPLLRDSMIRQHARGVENLILLAGHADGEYSGLTTSQGLLKYASTQSRSVATGTTGTLPALTAAGLLTLRKGMGKYGLKPGDVKYIVSQTAYFDLLEDAEFQDFNLVNTQATKLTGEVGQIFGSSVMVCDEFPAAAADNFYACAVNTRNFIIPRQRGMTIESDYSVEDQHRVLVTTQRLGFREIIANAKAVYGFAYPAAS